jgi:hypothetical protein
MSEKLLFISGKLLFISGKLISKIEKLISKIENLLFNIRKSSDGGRYIRYRVPAQRGELHKGVKTLFFFLTCCRGTFELKSTRQAVLPTRPMAAPHH